MPTDPRTSSRLDGFAARLTALGIVLLVAATLLFIHWEDLFPPERAAPAADDPVGRCVAERFAEIDEMAADGTIDERRANLFKDRAEALCESTVGGGNSGPPSPAPGLPQQ